MSELLTATHDAIQKSACEQRYVEAGVSREDVIRGYFDPEQALANFVAVSLHEAVKAQIPGMNNYAIY